MNKLLKEFSSEMTKLPVWIQVTFNVMKKLFRTFSSKIGKLPKWIQLILLAVSLIALYHVWVCLVLPLLTPVAYLPPLAGF